MNQQLHTKGEDTSTVPGDFIADYITHCKCHIRPIAEFDSVPR